MDHGMMLGIAVLFPIISALLVYLIDNYRARTIIVALSAAVLAVNSFMLFSPSVGDFQYSPAGTLWHTLIIVLDFALLLYVLYAGIARRSALVIIFALLQIVPLAYFEFVMHAHTNVGPIFYVDNLAKIMIAMISVIGSVICFYGVRYIRDHEEHSKVSKSRQGRFLFWTMFFLGAMNGLVCANNLYYLYFFWEVTTVCSYLLIGHDLTKESLRNATRALWINSLGGVAFCISIMYLYAYCGHENSLSLLYILRGEGLNPGVLLPLTFLCFTGFTKSAQLPFQSWLLGAMVAPTPVSALLHSSTMVKAGVYLIIRMMPAFAFESTGTSGVVIGLMIALFGAVTFVVASLLAISQTTGKKVLAYSTIANLGLIIMCAGINNPLSLAAAIFLTVFHAVSKALLFLSAGTVEHIVWSREIDDMQGLIRKAPITAVLMAIGILSMFLPPFGMLFSKWLAIEAFSSFKLTGVDNFFLFFTVKSLLFFIFFMCVVSSAATMVFFGKWLGLLLSSNPGARAPQKEKISSAYLAPLGLLAAGTVLMALLVGPVYHYVVSPAVANVLPLSASYGLAVNANPWQVGISGISQLTSVKPMFEGLYPVIALFLLLGGIIVPIFFKKVKEKEISPAYICGEHVDSPPGKADGMESDEYFSAGDKKRRLEIANFYYKGYFGEAVLTPVANSVAIALIVSMLGVVMGVTLL